MKLNLFAKKEERKVEYLELIYDLIFVYIIGRNNSLLHNIEGGFVPLDTFLAYILSSIAIIQIWNFSTYYINMHGRNGLRDHISLFVNMYLLYYLGEGTRIHWESSQNRYHIAWALILINLGLQYLIELRNHKDDAEIQYTIKRMMLSLFGEAAIVLIAIPVFNATGVQLAPLAVLWGILITMIFSNSGAKERLVDFSHLSERVMLYVVFTFGEMIIAIASYFEGGFNFSTIFFSLGAFLIVVALFLCYEHLYDRVIDREKKTNGMLYMIIHIFLIFAMNCITASLEFMRNEEVNLVPKAAFLVASFLLFMLCIVALGSYAKTHLRFSVSVKAITITVSVLFALFMFLFIEKMYINLTVSVIYVFSIFAIIYFSTKKQKAALTAEK